MIVDKKPRFLLKRGKQKPRMPISLDTTNDNSPQFSSFVTSVLPFVTNFMNLSKKKVTFSASTYPTRVLTLTVFMSPGTTIPEESGFILQADGTAKLTYSLNGLANFQEYQKIVNYASMLAEDLEAPAEYMMLAENENLET